MGTDSTSHARTLIFQNSHHKVDIVLLCVNPYLHTSLTNAKNYWLRDLNEKNFQKSRIILVGLYDIKPASSGPTESITAKRFASTNNLDYFEICYYDRDHILHVMNEAIIKALDMK